MASKVAELDILNTAVCMASGYPLATAHGHRGRSMHNADAKQVAEAQAATM